MADERLPKRAAELREQGMRRRGRPRLRWGGLCKERCEEDRRGGRLEEEDRRQRRVEKNSRLGGEKVAGSTSPLIKGKRGRERDLAKIHKFQLPVAR